MENKLLVTPAPHITKSYSTNVLMCAILFALVPGAVSGIVNFGVNALYIILIGVGCGYLFQLLFTYVKDRKFVWWDMSGLVTGFVTSLILPCRAPLYYPIIASFLAVIIFKCLFGGNGRNIFNPAAAARVVMGFIFSGLSLSLFAKGAVNSPLAYFVNGDYSSLTIRSLFFGTAPGAIGTASIICILIAGILLMCFKITDFLIPVGGLITFVVTVWIGGGAISIIPYMFSGSFLFALMFMVTDPTTSPSTIWGKLVYGLLFGFFAGLFRNAHVLGETSVFVAILIVNLLAGLIDKIFAPHPIGVRRSR